MRKADADDGFTLVEVVVAMFILAIVASSVAAILVQALRVTGDNTRRTTAANIAAEQIEDVRTQRAVDIADTAVSTTTVGGTTYTVSQNAAYQASDSAASICTGAGTKVSAKRVTVSVTWPSMGQTKPVDVSTLVSLGLGQSGLDSTKAISAVYVQSAANTPQTGIAVTLSPGGMSKTTGADGCAVFTGLDPTANYSATVNQTGYVDELGVQNSTRSVNVQGAGTVGRTVLNYDVPALLTTTYAAPGGYSTTPLTPTDPGTYLSFSKWSSNRYQSSPSAGSQRLFPGTYFSWAGLCSKAAAPSDALLTSGQASVALTAGGSGVVNVPLGGIVVKASDAVVSANRTVYAVQTNTGTGSGCPTGQPIAIKLSSTGQAAVALPVGTWSFSRSSSGAPVTTGTPLVNAPDSASPTAPSVTVVMS
ncbi:prepilin-type N-terminal cleavage/methylation domain-containing protein [Kineococcus sp. DHX-1]|uniref:type IV pilus modification PilV family protein n=1 Tax=Kineococcus sp. DHX-1 TaxID=3349638 RepID=UPI0036D38086